MINLTSAMANVNGASFIGLDTTTIVKLTGGKGNNMQGRVRKHMKGASVMVFQNKNSHGYDNMVKRRLVAEGKDPESFKLSARAWGQRVENMPIVTHKGAEYLEVIFLKAGEVSYTFDGQPIAKEDINGLPEKPVEAAQGGLTDKVIIRTFKAESIDEIRIDGQAVTA